MEIIHIVIIYKFVCGIALVLVCKRVGFHKLKLREKTVNAITQYPSYKTKNGKNGLLVVCARQNVNCLGITLVQVTFFSFCCYFLYEKRSLNLWSKVLIPTFTKTWCTLSD